MMMDKVVNAYMKLVYHQPRPFMIDREIISYSCSKGFGNPSGHSSAAWSFAIILFLDIFHGMPHGKNQNELQDVYFPSNITYLIGLLFALSWGISLPFSRFILGAHSLDQLVYGSSVGVLLALTMHFFIRDHLLAHMEKVINFQNNLKISSKNDETLSCDSEANT
jgi:membrane-associated phospholipid phosphatase